MNLYNLYTGLDELMYEKQQHTNPVIVWNKIQKGRKAGYLADIRNEAREGRYRDVLKKDAEIATLFARDILLGAFDEGEEAISKSARWSYVYAANVTGERFKQGEEAISKDTHYWNLYKKEFNL